MPYITSAVFLLSSLISFGLIYFQYSHLFSQQIISGVLLASLLLLGKFNNVKKKTTPWQTYLAVLLSSFLVQILIISSGGLYSPLLIVVHIYTLGAIFLLNSKTPIIFLLLTLAVLAGQIKYDQLLVGVFQNDPWTGVIYGLSFLIVVPLALYLSHHYFLKDGLAKLLKNYISMQEQKEDSILTALSDLVIVTDPVLKIASVNVAVEKYLSKEHNEIVGKNFFEIFSLKDVTGAPADSQALSINAALSDKASRFVEGFILENGEQMKPKPVSIQVRPLTDQNGIVSQLVFVMSDPSSHKQTGTSHPVLSEALQRRNTLFETLAHIPSSTPFSTIKSKIGLITHIEEDIYIAQELEDHQIQEKPVLLDMVILVKEILNQKQTLAQLLAVESHLAFTDPDGMEAIYISLQGREKDQSAIDATPSTYTLPIEKKFTGIMLAKIFELGFLIASATSDRNLVIDISQDNRKNIYLKVSMPNPGLTAQELPDLLVLNNPSVSQKTHLQFGSGLEGFIFKKLCTVLSLPYQVELDLNNTKITIQVTFARTAR